MEYYSAIKRNRFESALMRWMNLLLLLSRFSHVCLFATPWDIAYHAPLSMGFSRQEYRSG